MPPRPATAICLAGPTAAGKTALAVELATRYPLSIISVDSAMVYRGMDVGTGKPGDDVQAVAPHRLIDLRHPWESYSAGDFVADARAAIAEVVASGRVPLLVGGTLLYFRALLSGLAPLPQADPQVRAAIEERAAVGGWAALHAELAALDPASASRIAPGDKQRIQRALEVRALTGQPLSALQARAGTAGAAGVRFVRLAILPGDRAVLHKRIEARFDAMLAAGFVEEVRRLRSLPEMHERCPSMRAVGYRQLWQMLAGDCSHDDAVQAGLAATRQLARRQLTWIRAERWDATLDSTARDPVAAVLDALRIADAADALSAVTG
jgi:tRNA dimethylallyltransferase